MATRREVARVPVMVKTGAARHRSTRRQRSSTADPTRPAGRPHGVGSRTRSFADRLARGERVRFQRFLAAYIVVCAALGLWNLLVGAAFDDGASALSGAFVLAYSGVAVVGWFLAGRGDLRLSAQVVAGGVLATNAALITLVPVHGAIQLLLPFIAVTIAMPHVERRELAVLLLVAWVECVVVLAIATAGGPLGTAPAGLTWARRTVGPALLCGLIMVLVWLFKVRSADTLAAIRNREEAAQAARARYRSLFNGNPVGLFRATPSGAILDVNPALIRALGLAGPAALTGRRVPWLADDLLSEARAGEVRARDVETTTADGTPIWLRLSVHAVGAARDLLLEGSAEDITEQRRTEERLMQAVKLESVGRLAGGV